MENGASTVMSSMTSKTIVEFENLFPLEILCAIFEYFDPQNLSEWVPLLLVCRRWYHVVLRDFFLSSLSLPDDLFSLRYEYSTAKVTGVLSRLRCHDDLRSRVHTLKLTFMWSYFCRDDPRVAVQDILELIRLEVRTCYLSEFHSEVPISLPIPPLPQLRHLAISAFMDPEFDLAARFPALQASSASLRTFSLDAGVLRWPEDINSLPKFRELRSLSVFGVASDPSFASRTSMWNIMLQQSAQSLQSLYLVLGPNEHSWDDAIHLMPFFQEGLENVKLSLTLGLPLRHLIALPPLPRLSFLSVINHGRERISLLELLPNIIQSSKLSLLSMSGFSFTTSDSTNLPQAVAFPQLTALCSKRPGEGIIEYSTTKALMAPYSNLKAFTACYCLFHSFGNESKGHRDMAQIVHDLANSECAPRLDMDLEISGLHPVLYSTRTTNTNMARFGIYLAELSSLFSDLLEFRSVLIRSDSNGIFSLPGCDISFKGRDNIRGLNLRCEIAFGDETLLGGEPFGRYFPAAERDVQFWKTKVADVVEALPSLQTFILDVLDDDEFAPRILGMQELRNSLASRGVRWSAF
ncbi:hypothetical protein BT69DRAFT_1328209 [Atractiella rhizophila]|nr:hypothetical protein BT69DRAFT_1328209 [Atractiella rhizophila]